MWCSDPGVLDEGRCERERKEKLILENVIEWQDESSSQFSDPCSIHPLRQQLVSMVQKIHEDWKE